MQLTSLVVPVLLHRPVPTRGREDIATLPSALFEAPCSLSENRVKAFPALPTVQLPLAPTRITQDVKGKFLGPDPQTYSTEISGSEESKYL